VEVHLKHAEQEKRKDGAKSKTKPVPRPQRTFFRPDGTAYNINEGGFDFVLEGQDAFQQVLQLLCWGFLAI
jgi:hypothetical protein